MTVANPIQGLAYYRIIYDEHAHLDNDGGLPQPGSTDELRVIGWVEDAGAA